MQLLNIPNNGISNHFTVFETSLFKAIYKNVSLSDRETFAIPHIDEFPGYAVFASEANGNDKIFNLLKDWGNIIEEIHSKDHNGDEYIDVAPLFNRLRFYTKDMVVTGKINKKVLNQLILKSRIGDKNNFNGQIEIQKK